MIVDVTNLDKGDFQRMSEGGIHLRYFEFSRVVKCKTVRKKGYVIDYSACEGNSQQNWGRGNW